MEIVETWSNEAAYDPAPASPREGPERVESSPEAGVLGLLLNVVFAAALWSVWKTRRG